MGADASPGAAGPGPTDRSATPPRLLLATASMAAGMDEDAAPLGEALDDLGVAWADAVWDDPGVDWSSAALVVVRSTWDYAPRRGEFLAWADAVGSVTTLANPPALLRWNTDKRYLHDLSAGGVPVVRTTFLGPGTGPEERRGVMAAHAAAGRDWVVKPSVSAGSKDTGRFGPGDLDAALGLAAAIAASGRTTMVQPYQEAIDERGETGLVYFDGVFSHAFEKAPMLGAGGGVTAVDNSPSSLFVEERIRPRVPTAEELRLGDAALAPAVARLDGTAPLYARVDLVPDDSGHPCVMELELTEPSWFLGTDPASAVRAAVAIAGHLPGGG